MNVNYNDLKFIQNFLHSFFVAALKSNNYGYMCDKKNKE